MISPSVNISTNDTPNYNVSTSNNVALFVGEFEKGPINEPKIITSPLQFKQIFGRATSWNYDSWYQVYNYLQYASNIIVCRTASLESVASSNNGNVANSPGEWGDLISVLIADNDDYINNIDTPTGKIQNVVTEAEMDGNQNIIIVYRDGKLVEKFTFNDLIEVQSFYIETFNLQKGYYQLSGGKTVSASSEDMKTSLDIFGKENYDIDIVICNDLFQDIFIEFVEQRKDCILFMGIPLETYKYLLINNNFLLTDTGKFIVVDVYKFIFIDDNIKTEIINLVQSYYKSEYVYVSLGYKKILDKFSGKHIIINTTGDIAGLRARAANDNPWALGAGLERGKILNGEFIEVKQQYANDLIKVGVNVLQNGYVMSQNMLSNIPTDKMNVRIIMNALKRKSEKLVNKHIFKVNEITLRETLARELKMLLEDMKNSRGIEAGKVVVTSRDDNVIIINIFVKLYYVSEFVNIRFTNVGANTTTEIYTVS